MAAWMPTYSPPWTPLVISRVFPGRVPLTKVTGSWIDPPGTSTMPCTFSPSRAVKEPTVNSLPMLLILSVVLIQPCWLAR